MLGELRDISKALGTTRKAVNTSRSTARRLPMKTGISKKLKPITKWLWIGGIVIGISIAGIVVYKNRDVVAKIINGMNITSEKHGTVKVDVPEVEREKPLPMFLGDISNQFITQY